MTKLNGFIFLAELLALCVSITANAEASCEETLQIISGQKVQIGGTLAIPKEKKTDTLVIMLSGSGPQDRDETLDGFKVFKELSHELYKHGIPTFRFDDRGVGQSTGNFVSSTLTDHANDVRSIIEHFKNHETYRFKKFTLLGHSQGGIVSAHVAIGSRDVEKVVLMGAPAVPLVE